MSEPEVTPLPRRSVAALEGIASVSYVDADGGVHLVVSDRLDEQARHQEAIEVLRAQRQGGRSVFKVAKGMATVVLAAAVLVTMAVSSGAVEKLEDLVAHGPERSHRSLDSVPADLGSRGTMPRPQESRGAREPRRPPDGGRAEAAPGADLSGGDGGEVALPSPPPEGVSPAPERATPEESASSKAAVAPGAAPTASPPVEALPQGDPSPTVSPDKSEQDVVKEA